MEPSVLSGLSHGAIPAQSARGESITKVVLPADPEDDSMYRHPLNVAGEPRQLYLTALLLGTFCALFAVLGVASYALSGAAPTTLAACCAVFALAGAVLRRWSLSALWATDARPKDISRALALLLGVLIHLAVAAVVVLASSQVIANGVGVGLALGIYLAGVALMLTRGVWALLIRRALAVLPLLIIDGVAGGIIVAMAHQSQYLRTTAEHTAPLAALVLGLWIITGVTKSIYRKSRPNG